MEVLGEILSFLSIPDRLKFCQVNKKSTKCIYDANMWQFVDLKGVIVISTTLFKVLDMFALKVRSIYLDSRSFIETCNLKVELMLGQLRNLELLDLSRTNIVCSLDFIENLDRLEHLIINNVSVELQLSCIKHVPKCPSLATFSFRENLVVGGGAITSMLSQLPNLCWADIEGSSELFPSQVEEIATHCPQLHTLLFNMFCHGTVDHRAWINLKTVKFPNLGMSFDVSAQIKRLESMYRWLDR